MTVCPECLAVQVGKAMERLSEVTRSAETAGLLEVAKDVDRVLDDLDDVCTQLMAAMDDARCEHGEEAP